MPSGWVVQGTSLMEGYTRLVSDNDLLGLREEVQVMAGRSRELFQRITAGQGESGLAWKGLLEDVAEVRVAIESGDSAKLAAALGSMQGTITRAAGTEQAWTEWQANLANLSRVKESEQRRMERAQILMSVDRVMVIVRMIAALAVRCITERPRLSEFERELVTIVEGQGASEHVKALLMQSAEPVPG